MKICDKCNQPEIRYYHNRCHTCYLALRRKSYQQTKNTSIKSRKTQYRLQGHYIWVREIINTWKRKRSKQRNNFIEPDKSTLKLLAIALANKLSATPKCIYTGEVLVPGNISLDHKIPISRRPDLAYSYDNLQWVSKTYNHCKSNLTDDEFLELCKTVLDNRTAGAN